MMIQSSTYSDAAAISVADSVGISVTDLAVALMMQSQECIKMLSVDGHLDFVNCNGVKALEAGDAKVVLGKIWWSLWPEETQDLVRAKFHESVCGRETAFEAECPTMKGTQRRWSVSLKPLYSSTGEIVSVLCVSRML